jgi:hypothetical protein
MVAIKPINEDVIPANKNAISCTLHQGWHNEVNEPTTFDPYEKNPLSKAYVAEPCTFSDFHFIENTGPNEFTAYITISRPGKCNLDFPYHQASLFGGTPETMADFCDKLDMNIDDDYRKGITAKVWDESHLNRLLIDGYPCKTLDRRYNRPEIFKRRADTIILNVRKEIMGPIHWLRN